MAHLTFEVSEVMGVPLSIIHFLGDCHETSRPFDLGKLQ